MVRTSVVRLFAGIFAFAGALLLVAIVPTGTIAQSDAPAPPVPKAAPAASAKPAAPSSSSTAQRTTQVSIDQELLLVRSTLLTLNDANRSGNYTVLRDLAAPEFQVKNTSADLALVFAEMRRNNLSLFGVMLLTPQLEAVPEVDAEGRLRLSGFVPTRPLQVKFDLLFEASAGQWKLLNIAISTPQGEPPKTQEQKPVASDSKVLARQPPTAAKAATPKPPPPKVAPTEEEKR